MLIVNALFWFILALFLALVEIEIEGKYGWAEKTNTWYRKKGIAAKIWGVIHNGRPLTGYNLFLSFFLLLIFHSGFFFGLSWSLNKELETLALYFAFVVFWDFLWFVFNPNYTIRNYKKDKIWWFNKSYWIFGVFPIDYLNGVVLSLILAYFAGILIYQIELIGLFLLFTLIAILLAPLYPRWYKNMRKRDDRKISGIFHR